MAKKKAAKRTVDPCAGIRKRLKTVEDQIQELRDFLPEAPPSERRRIQAVIARLQELLRGLVRDLARCEREHSADQ